MRLGIRLPAATHQEDSGKYRETGIRKGNFPDGKLSFRELCPGALREGYLKRLASAGLFFLYLAYETGVSDYNSAFQFTFVPRVTTKCKFTKTKCNIYLTNSRMRCIL